jgi:hypothetical protein
MPIVETKVLPLPVYETRSSAQSLYYAASAQEIETSLLSMNREYNSRGWYS